ncbi:M20 family metallopeptidase [Sporosarcina sp. Sa2YVA2]|uniref:M20 family metallopeptidase n=1 Tax=Sporosarcina quadrami TaxID=2762234 RepID=A0ABR8U960_9BACL|nr:M20 family metallopeptidase [Sporosarcina quadrami]MBD7984561.1 M20 family metallopeptidase [Sporosarcina quadrami]
MQIQEDLKSFLEQRQESAINFLKELVNTDSSAGEKHSVDEVGELIRQRLSVESVDYEVRQSDDYGDTIIARIAGKRPGKILLMGHMDTAFPLGTVKERPFSQDGNLLRGPGVSDMKSGLVTMMEAVIALKELASDTICDIELLFTPDEEIGSPHSRELIQELAADALAVFNLEPGRPDGSIVTARKGSAHHKITVEGKAAHSGAFIENGISANDELALKMIEIKKLMDIEKGITINFGKIEGGIGNNVVSPSATATIHLAFWTLEHYEQTVKAIQKVVDHSFVPGSKSTLSGKIGMLPMEKTAGVGLLFSAVREAGEMIGYEVTEQRTKGAADAGFTASLGIPTICGMGPVGGNWHGVDEYMELDTFCPRTLLLATSILQYLQQD